MLGGWRRWPLIVVEDPHILEIMIESESVESLILDVHKIHRERCRFIHALLNILIERAICQDTHTRSVKIPCAPGILENLIRLPVRRNNSDGAEADET